MITTTGLSSSPTSLLQLLYGRWQLVIAMLLKPFDHLGRRKQPGILSCRRNRNRLQRHEACQVVFHPIGIEAYFYFPCRFIDYGIIQNSFMEQSSYKADNHSVLALQHLCYQCRIILVLHKAFGERPMVFAQIKNARRNKGGIFHLIDRIVIGFLEIKVLILPPQIAVT